MMIIIWIKNGDSIYKRQEIYERSIWIDYILYRKVKEEYLKITKW